MEVLIDEFFIVESWKGIDVKKSLNQSRVFVKNSDGNFVQYGIVGHPAMQLCGLVGVPNELGEAIAEACTAYLKTKGPEAIRGKKVKFVGAPLMDEDIDPNESEEDE